MSKLGGKHESIRTHTHAHKPGGLECRLFALVAADVRIQDHGHDPSGNEEADSVAGAGAGAVAPSPQPRRSRRDEVISTLLLGVRACFAAKSGNLDPRYFISHKATRELRIPAAEIIVDSWTQALAAGAVAAAASVSDARAGNRTGSQVGGNTCGQAGSSSSSSSTTVPPTPTPTSSTSTAAASAAGTRGTPLQPSSREPPSVEEVAEILAVLDANAHTMCSTDDANDHRESSDNGGSCEDATLGDAIGWGLFPVGKQTPKQTAPSRPLFPDRMLKR